MKTNLSKYRMTAAGVMKMWKTLKAGFPHLSQRLGKHKTEKTPVLRFPQLHGSAGILFFL
jgi:hypothetical protein